MDRDWQALVLLSAALIVIPAVSANPSITVNDSRCGADVTVVARNVPLSQVLGELAEALSFRTSVEAAADRNVNVSLSAPAGAVIAALTRHDNVILVEEYDPACGGLRRPVRVTVLEGRPSVVGDVVMELPQVAPAPELTVVPPRLTRLARIRDDGKDEAPVRRRNRN